jgi:hypothetical protein
LWRKNARSFAVSGRVARRRAADGTSLVDRQKSHLRMTLRLTPAGGHAPDPRSFEVLDLEPMKAEEGTQLLDRWLRSVHRTVTAEQRGRILERFADCPLPLDLRLMFEEARAGARTSRRRSWRPTRRA